MTIDQLDLALELFYSAEAESLSDAIVQARQLLTKLGIYTQEWDTTCEEMQR